MHIYIQYKHYLYILMFIHTYIQIYSHIAFVQAAIILCICVLSESTFINMEVIVTHPLCHNTSIPTFINTYTHFLTFKCLQLSVLLR